MPKILKIVMCLLMLLVGAVAWEYLAVMPQWMPQGWVIAIAEVTGMIIPLYAVDAEPQLVTQIRHVLSVFYVLYSWIAVLLIVALAAARRWIWPAATLLCALVLTVLAQLAWQAEMAAIQTFTYEYYYAALYLWMAALLWLFVLYLALGAPRVLHAALVLTLIFTAIAVVEGRGSSEHVVSLIGLSFQEPSLRALLRSTLLYLPVAMLSLALAVGLLRVLWHWINRGGLALAAFSKPLQYAGIWVVVSLLPLVSIPLGEQLNEQDVEAALRYVEQQAVLAEEHRIETGEYPRDIRMVAHKDAEKPRLVRIYEYYSNNIEGAYYLSRAKKYCFIVHNPGKDFGYFTLTSDQEDWSYYNNVPSLEEHYAEVCGERGLKSHESLMANYLGLHHSEDRYGKISIDLDRVIRPAMTAASTGELKEELGKLGEQDPSILYNEAEDEIPEEPLEWPEGAEVTPEMWMIMLDENTQSLKEAQ